jgi:hypothetical protein
MNVEARKLAETRRRDTSQLVKAESISSGQLSPIWMRVSTQMSTDPSRSSTARWA